MKVNKSWVIAASCVLATSLMTGSVFAKSDNANNVKKEEASVTSKAPEKDAAKEKESKSTAEQEGVNSVTDSTYGKEGKNGYKGLLHAIENVKDKPAGAVIAEQLLVKYGAALSAEKKAELEAIVEKDAALSAAADVLDKQGNVTDAVYAQKDAVKANLKNIDSYKKLGKLYKKLGKKGVLLYVNGEEPVMEVHPFIREGSTLVPFRAIAEALKAEVSWNAEERSVTVTRDGITVKLFIDSTTAYVNGKEVTLEVAASITEGNTVVPVRFISESLKAVVEWESETTSVIVYEE
ncbi:Copper amine oxidase N-terminal domain-containing protein [Paenibacillus sp. UNCCL117]|uniref:copper amine oxidase N-terminal domain-containing protein n=1 Tax=unclassified Paenibacillus TaxID=185978 RepID=UPI0008888DDD|nr:MULTISPECIES: copper amine oxidase N-terminal domain-containing protein [unclassified Paenibacillus]SDE12313.1 Copper amine oxidase N-terminal domain-containing protein [Paenibacillus sp. cl123]SFW60155.1 Copper amine oxidase N-terminal domain-containing protein [Paenibacillus sp. UNCCL117]